MASNYADTINSIYITRANILDSHTAAWLKLRLNSEYPLVGNEYCRFYDYLTARKVTEFSYEAMKDIYEERKAFAREHDVVVYTSQRPIISK